LFGVGRELLQREGLGEEVELLALGRPLSKASSAQPETKTIFSAEFFWRNSLSERDSNSRYRRPIFCRPFDLSTSGRKY
jgi:hypothetical protein